MTADDFLSASDAARELGLSISALTRRAQMGSIPAKKIGGTWLIAKSDLDEIRALVRPKRKRTAPAS